VNDTRSRLFWPAVIVGWAVMAVGVTSAWSHRADVAPAAFARWLLLLLFVHDLVVVPAVLLVGATLSRVAPRRWRAAIQVTLAVTGLVALYAWPYVRRWGTVSSNPSIQPRDYGEGLALTLAALAVVGLSVAGVARARRS
jgi:hypothetical protein